MFEFLFKYPPPVFTKGHFVLLSAWPVWLLASSIILLIAALGWLTYRRFSSLALKLRTWRVWALWGMQSTFLALILILLWQPAMLVAALTSQQNIIAVVIDNSRSMASRDSDGKTRESVALSLLEKDLLPEIRKKFQVRLYRLGNSVSRVDNLPDLQPQDPATNINGGLKKLVEDTSNLPIGALLLLSDGGQNSAEIGESGIALDTLRALQNRKLPVHTIGFGRLQISHDIELENISLPSTAVLHSRLSADLSFMQHGFAGQSAAITIWDGEGYLARRTVKLAPDGVLQTEPLFFSAGIAGIRDLRFTIDTLQGEENLKNNAVTRSLLVNASKRRVLYVEGEPRWEFKFIRRAEEEDPTIQLISMLRTSENKIYRQGVSGPGELADGFPTRPEDLFGYSAIIIGSIDANYFSPMQRELLREYADRRGGGILFLGGRMSLSEGGWGTSNISELLPTSLPSERDSFHRNAATVELTAIGADSAITRLRDDPIENAQRWKRLTYLADFQNAGSPKPGAVVLLQMNTGRRELPLLVTQSYGHGRTAVLATGGTWRWQMGEPLGDPSHDLFWQQLIRWLVADSPTAVMASVSPSLLINEGRIQLSAQVYDAQFNPAVDLHVAAHILGPEGSDALIDLPSSQLNPGKYTVSWNAEKPGDYLAELTAINNATHQELGRDTVIFRREDGIAEDFRTQQNRELLQQLASQTGGRYWEPNAIGDLPQNISYSEAGISVRTTNPLWNMPAVFLMLSSLLIAEWLLRRKWGVI
ncbi:hypothetical protein JAO29_09835 [Edaphobacter sp. HDX4]|uniref:hypothetical protein n=1 Tax=Edaphobacter sp. HDX4 TaxID=2794064 RepID=UPI002FE69DD7